MSTDGVGDGQLSDDVKPTGSALLGMLLALVIVVGSVCASFYIPIVIDDLVYDFQTRNLPEDAGDDAWSADERRGDAAIIAETDARSVGADGDEDGAPADAEESPAGDNLLLALVFLASPVPGLLVAGICLHRRRRLRTVKGYWIGVLSGMISLTLVLGGLWHIVTFGTFG